MKPIWRGTLSFGLVTLPIDLFSAVASHAIGFTLLHMKCHTPIQYQRWCPHCKEVVSYSDLLRGIKYKGTYIGLTEEQLKKLKPEKSQVLTIIEFVQQEQILPIYYDKHYYLLPGKESVSKAFNLFMAALKKTNKTAIAKLILREKEYICAVQPYENILLLSTLNYAYEIKPIEQHKQLTMSISSAELKLAEQLIGTLSKKEFKLDSFKDTFATQLREKIKLLAQSGKRKITRKKVTTKKITTQPSLVDMLHASITHARPKK